MSGAEETIVAPATPAGRGAIGILRLSGPRAFAIAEALSGRRPRHRRVELVTFRAGDGRAIDRGLQLGFRGPRSFTGEDVVELHAHGAPVVLAMLEERMVELGARRARPGEFSERAFHHGKLDLAQAEALADLIAAGSRRAAQAALRSLSGAFSRRCEALAERLLALRVEVEALIDFPEEELGPGVGAALGERLAFVRAELERLLGEARIGRRLRDGLHVVLLGRPNAGKSSLLNALLGEERAIVTPIPGTTRDLLREELELGGLSLTLVDTAGLREQAGAVEAEGIRRARQEAARADLALLVLDAERGDAAEPLAAELPPGLPALRVYTKVDLVPGFRPPAGALAVSALSGEGLAALRTALAEHAGGVEADGGFSARARHLEALGRVRAHLGAAAARLEERACELMAEELRLAQRALGEVTGAVGSEELLAAIFASFCIGK